MIYNKDAAFPYPVLSRTSASYKENYFIFNIETIKENNDAYIFPISYKLSSPFIEKLLIEKKATLVLIVQSGDSYFERLDYDIKKIELKKTRLSLSKRTKVQLHIQTLEDISFKDANDLSEFYNEYKDEIVVKRHSLLGYSDEVVFEGSETKALEIFEQSIDKKLKVPFEIQLKSETILLVFRDKKDTLENGNMKKGIRNMYLYLGLNRALNNFFETYGKDEEFLDISTVTMIDNGLHLKLKDLMLSKGITEIASDNLDEIIQKMSDGIIEKYTDSIRMMSEDGN